jgi:hypothetical protein
LQGDEFEVLGAKHRSCALGSAFDDSRGKRVLTFHPTF